MHEERAVRCVRSPMPQVIRHRSRHPRRQRKPISSPSFSCGQGEDPGAPVHVIEREPSDFAGSQAQVEQEQCNSVIAPPVRALAIERGQQRVDLVVRQHPWNAS